MAASGANRTFAKTLTSAKPAFHRSGTSLRRLKRELTMACATTYDAVRLYYEETGGGSPIIFVHEFAGDHRSWEQQLQHFGQRYRGITYAARGYPPSDVTEDAAAYTPNRAAGGAGGSVVLQPESRGRRHSGGA